MAGPSASCSSCTRMREGEGRVSTTGVLRGACKWLAGFAVLAGLQGAEAFGPVGGRMGGTHSGLHSPSFLRPTSSTIRQRQQHDPRSVWGLQQPLVMRVSSDLRLAGAWSSVCECLGCVVLWCIGLDPATR